MSSEASDWVGVAAAIVAASSALTGLVFVSMSINIDRIIALAGVPEMALQGIVVLAGVLVGGVVVLAPGIGDPGLGSLLVLVGALLLLVIGGLHGRAVKVTDPQYRSKRLQTSTLNGIPGALYLAAGVGLLIGDTFAIWLLLPAWIIGMIAGLVSAWVLLVEIKR